MQIRKATKAEAPEIASCLLLAMDTIIYAFMGTKDNAAAKAFLVHFVTQENNQYSYENCWVAVENNIVIGAINCYDGAALEVLRAPILAYLKTNYNNPIVIEDETQEGEIYIDTFGVIPDQQGKGIGSQLLGFLIEKYVVNNQKTLGLLVEEANEAAKKLYLKLGFIPVTKKTLVGKNMEQLQIKPAFLS